MNILLILIGIYLLINCVKYVYYVHAIEQNKKLKITDLENSLKKLIEIQDTFRKERRTIEEQELIARYEDIVLEKYCITIYINYEESFLGSTPSIGFPFNQYIMKLLNEAVYSVIDRMSKIYYALDYTHELYSNEFHERGIKVPIITDRMLEERIEYVNITNVQAG